MLLRLILVSMTRRASFPVWVFVLCVGVAAAWAQDGTLFSLPNDFNLIDVSSVDDWDGVDDCSDSDGTIVQTGGIVNQGRYPIGSRSFTWHDASRRRTVPAQVYFPTTKGQRFPVIVFSHGLGGSPTRCSYLGSAWASRGFVVVLLQHHGSDENVWQGKLRVMNELREAYKTCWNGRTRALDIRFALDRLESLEKSGDWLGSLLDLENIGVGGYDLGSLGALLVAGQLPPDGRVSLADSRVKAVLAMSPPVNPPQRSYRDVYAAVGIPAFFITGTEDDGIVGSTKASQRRIPFDSMSGNDRFLVVFQGADHMIYGGHFLSIRGRNDQPFQRAICRSSTLFWQAYLKNDEQALTDISGYRLNSLLGVAATIERHIVSRSEEVRTVLEPNETTATPVHTETFPLTRFYRAIVMEN